MTEQQVRRALGAANDLEPPADDLFVERALQRGRARTGRRRSILVGAAASLALVGVVGGTWVSSQGLREGFSVSAGSAGGSAEDAGVPQSASGGDKSGGGQSGGGQSGPVEAPGRPGIVATHSSGWVAGRVTPQTAALEEMVGTLTLNYADVFGGAYATDETNTHLVVTLTRRHPELEALVVALMPDPGDVSFEVVSNTALRKQEVAAQVTADAAQWRSKGVTIVGVRLDARADRVVVAVREATGVAAIEDRYGKDVVRAEVGSGPPLGGTVTDPSGPTMPTPEG